MGKKSESKTIEGYRVGDLRRKPDRPFYSFTFGDGEVWEVDAGAWNAEHVAQRKRLSQAYGRAAPHSSKLTLDVITDIHLLFADRLFNREKYSELPVSQSLAAWNAARTWTINSIAGKYEVTERTARRWIEKTLGSRRGKTKKK